jgi:S-adenosylmethionine hydrolase
MPDPLITLTTDFGDESPYVAAMKGVILGINPVVRLVDLSHRVPPQDLRYAAYFLANALPFFPGGTIHVIVVDPGVGTERALLCVESAGQRLLVPDNGCWTTMIREWGDAPRVVRLTEARYWRQPVSTTFHGRDILAPAAGHLSLGLDPLALGPLTDRWVWLESPDPRPGRNSWIGEVVFIDHFGNLITNISADYLGNPSGPRIRIAIGKHWRRLPWVPSYGHVQPGKLIALLSSSGMLEVAVNQGNAAHRLKAAIGTPVTVSWAR